MAPPVGTLRVGRYFLTLVAIFALLYLIVFFPGARHTPKLGLDLEGGTQVIFTAKTTNGSAPSSSSMSQAKQIMTDRVNGTGVTEATVVVQGSDQLVVSIPGSTNTDVAALGAAAVLNFRGLVAPPVPVGCVTPTPAKSSGAPSTSPGASPSTANSPAGSQPSGTSVNDAGHHLLTPRDKDNLAPSTTPKTTPSTTPKTTPSTKPKSTPGATSTPAPTATSTPPPPKCSADPFAALVKSGVKIPTSDTAFNALPADQQSAITAAMGDFNCAAAQGEKDLPKQYYIACDDGTQYGQPYVHLLGTVIVPGHEINTASAVAPNISAVGGSADWTVSLSLKSSGQASWGKYTSKHNIGSTDPANNPSPTTCSATTTPCADFVGFTLDGVVISTPVNQSAINGGNTQISGSFTPSSSKDLANKLKYGALPLTFKADQAETVSATLGTSQLKSGLLAGGIGLVLVVIYSLLYYRALGLVTIASLLVSGALTYGSLVMLATQIGFTLSLAGIAGFIVAIGITADSFVVFFERIKDEVHDGRSVRVAIPRAWTRARRTILSADTVSFLAAAILYEFAAGDVKGFAFTLGLSTILDLIVVFLFTHPLVSWLSRKKAFGSARFTGLNAIREGGVALSEEPVRPAKAKKAAPPAPRESAGRITLDKKSIALLDKESSAEDETAADEDEEVANGPVSADAQPVDTDEDLPAEDLPAEAIPAEAIPAEDDAAEPDAEDGPPPAERRRSTPEPGSAAERAAARRARLREKGKS